MQKFKRITLRQIQMLFKCMRFTNYDNCKYNFFVLKSGDGRMWDDEYHLARKKHEIIAAEMKFQALESKQIAAFVIRIHQCIFESIMEQKYEFGKGKLIDVSIWTEAGRLAINTMADNFDHTYYLSNSDTKILFQSCKLKTFHKRCVNERN